MPSVAYGLPSSLPPEPELTHGSYRNTWRWVVTMLDGSTVKTFLDKLATNVQVAYVLNGDSQQVTLDVPSDSDEVNHLADELPGHGPTKHPRVSENRRLLYGFRREEGAGLANPEDQPPWKCRWGGVITIVQDEAAEDVAITHVTSHDGWNWAKSLPVLNPDGSLPGANGVTYEGKTAGYVAKDVIANAYAWIVATYSDPLPWNDLPNDGQHLLIDIDSGHFGATDVIPTINFAQGCSVGEAWTQLVATGAIDINLEPVWGQPGVINILNVYATVGKRQPNAIFGWGKFPKNLVAADNLIDGTQLANYAQYFAGQAAAPAATEGTSIDAYGPYWQIKSYPSPASVDAVGLIAAADAALQRNGKQTVVVDPTPELAPDPFTQYFLGDEVSLVIGTTTKGGGSSFRSRFVGGLANKSHRVYALQISLADDLTETVTNLLLSDPDSAV